MYHNNRVCKIKIKNKKSAFSDSLFFPLFVSKLDFQDLANSRFILLQHSVES